METHSEQEMLEFGKSLGATIRSDSFFANSPITIELVGDIGAGKTSFVRGFAAGLGIKFPVSSPSFTISKTYAISNDANLIHYDFYRLDNPGLMREDLEENLKNKNNIIIIEWGSSIEDILPEKYLKITITKTDENSREITTEKISHEKTTTDSQAIKNNAAQTVSDSELTLYLDTSTPNTILKLNDKEYNCNFDRDLAEKLQKFIHDKLAENGKGFQDIKKIIFMSGPGSFTGLRIGAAIINTLAHELNIPLYTHQGEKVKIIIPSYGRTANISKPRK